MTIYAVAQINVTNPEKLAQYREHAAQALTKHNGQIVTAGAIQEYLEKNSDIQDSNAPDIAALLSFPDKEAALAWKNDPELQEIHALRNLGGKSTIYLLP